MNVSPKQDFLVGVFVLAGLAGLAYLSISLGGVSYTGRGGMPIYVVFDEVSGLKIRSPVMIGGVKVGQVEEIELSEDLRARVLLEVDETVALPLDTEASILTSGLLGDKYIGLAPGAEDAVLQPGDEITYVQNAVVLERLLGKAFDAMASSE